MRTSILSAFLGLFAVLSLTMPANASDVLTAIKEKAAFRKEMMQLINSSDRLTRLAAIEEALNGKDSELRISARQAAFTSKDERLQRLALRYVLNNSQSLQVVVEQPNRSSKIQKHIFNLFQAFSFNRMKVDPGSDLITVKNHNWSGRLIKGGFRMKYKRPRNYTQNRLCSMTVNVQSSDLLAGRLDCLVNDEGVLRQTDGENRAVLAIRIPL